MNKRQNNLESFRKTARMVANLTNTLGFKVKDEITKTSFLITPWLQRSIRQAVIVKDPTSITKTAVAFHMVNGDVVKYHLHCDNIKTPEMLQVMARKNTEITNFNYLTCHKENGMTYYSLNK